jgi:hypothetical protein
MRQLLLLQKRLWLDECLTVKPREAGIALDDGLCGLGGLILAEGLHD